MVRCENGKYKARNLVEAAQKAGIKLDTTPEGNIRLDEEGRPSVWACKIYDNEADARKYFG